MQSLHRNWLLDDLDVRVFTADLVVIDTSWNYRNAPLAHWRLYRNDDDGAKLHFRQEVIALKKKRIYLIPAGLRFTTSCETTLSHFFIHFNVSGLPDMALRLLFRRPHLLASSPILNAYVSELSGELYAPIQIWHDVHEISARKSGDVALQWRLKGAVYEALAQCVRDAPTAQVASCWEFAREVEPIVMALRFIEENLSISLSNAQLAQHCSMSCDHFIRVFRDAMEQTPAAYIRDKRVAEAARMLLSTDHNLDQIAQETGFCDRAHLTRVFKQKESVSPSQYRAQSQIHADITRAG